MKCFIYSTCCPLVRQILECIAKIKCDFSRQASVKQDENFLSVIGSRLLFKFLYKGFHACAEGIVRTAPHLSGLGISEEPT